MKQSLRERICSVSTIRWPGLSPRKARSSSAALRGLGQRVCSGEFDFDSLHRLSDDDVLARLVQLRGVGPWSAQVLMLPN